MPLPRASLALALACLIPGATAEEAAQPKRASAARQFLREHLTATLPPLGPTAPVPKEKSPILTTEVAVDQPAPPDLVTLAPVIVTRRRELSKEALLAAQRKEASFESNALYHKDLTKKVRIEALLPPEPGSQGGLALPIFRLSW